MEKRETYFDLGVIDAPHEVANVLARASNRFYAIALELESQQDESAGKSWRIVVEILDSAVSKIQLNVPRK